ncbi:MAG: PASTA domain-containing protein [Clostridia bacterium]|nr:PASTA domain-containing protein [Clostridia bacterium]
MGKKFCFAVLLFFAMSFTVADSLFGFLESDGDYVSVPNYCGQREQDVDLPEWAELQTSYRYDKNTPAGIIIEQKPAAGSELKVGKDKQRILTLTVSLGTEEKEIPNVLGQDIREASAILRDLGFVVNEISKAGGNKGEIIDITPGVGTKTDVGSTVTVIYSEGVPAETVTVPNLEGLSRGMALIELFRCDLTVGEVVEEASDAPAGTVIRQSPSAGNLVAPKTKIKITVSRGIEEESENSP